MYLNQLHSYKTAAPYPTLRNRFALKKCSVQGYTISLSLHWQWMNWTDKYQTILNDTAQLWSRAVSCFYNLLITLSL